MKQYFPVVAGLQVFGSVDDLTQFITVAVSNLNADYGVSSCRDNKTENCVISDSIICSMRNKKPTPNRNRKLFEHARDKTIWSGTKYVHR